MKPKRDLLADVSRFTGFTWALSSLPRKPLLIVLNYHRIGNPAGSPYDSEVFSATPEALDAQVTFWKSRFRTATLEEAIDMVESPGRHSGTAVLFTFDDGYLDNYESAFPILKGHGVEGVFFLPTSYIGTNRMAWWDSVAYIIRNCRKKSFRLTSPAAEFDLPVNGRDATIAKVLDLYRRLSSSNSESFLSMLEEACDSPRPNGSDRCFLNWEEAADMARGGMAIGSHTHSHEILSRLTPEEQLQELVTSRAILEQRLGRSVPSLSYPVGLRDSFSTATQEAAKQAGYRIAFSFYGGLNVPGAMNRYDVMRYSMAFGTSLGRYQLQTALAAVTGSYWF